jgi:hypothetical protein
MGKECNYQCKIWFALQDWQVWKSWEMEAQLFLWSRNTFNAVFPLRIFTGVRNKVSPTVFAINFSVYDCYGQYLQFFFYSVTFCFIFLLAVTFYKRVCVCGGGVMHVCVYTNTHSGAGVPFWRAGTYELDCDSPDGRIIADSTHTHTHTHTYMYIYIYVWTYLYMYVCIPSPCFTS